jgi:hypothetical protein
MLLVGYSIILAARFWLAVILYRQKNVTVLVPQWQELLQRYLAQIKI